MARSPGSKRLYNAVGRAAVADTAARRFWALAIQTAAPGAQERFIRAYGGFAQSLVQQTADRKNKRVLTVEEYFAARQDTIGAKPCFAVLEFDMDIPQHVMDDEVIQELVALTCDMITLSNVSSLGLCAHRVLTFGTGHVEL